MEDKNLKKLLNEDMSTPKRPVDEWRIISSKLKRESIFSKIIIPAMITASISLMVMINTINKKTGPTTTDLEIANYLLEEKLFIEGEDQLYAWVE